MRRVVSGSLYILVGALAGVGSALLGMDSLGSYPVGTGSPWQSWNLAPSGRAHPYALDHFLIAGRLPPATAQMREFAAQRTGGGDALVSDCRYRLVAPGTAGGGPRWWSMLATTGRGEPREASFLSSNGAIAESDGSIRITVSRDPAAGNWIQAPANGAFSLVYTVADPATVSKRRAPPAFSIERIGC